MKTPTYEQAPAFDPEHMERRTGEDRQVPIPLDYEQAHAHAKQANTAYRMAKVVRGKAATALSLAKTADTEAKKDLEEAFDDAEKGRAEADSLTRTISARVDLYFDYRAPATVILVRTDKGYKGIEFDRRAMTDDEQRDILSGIGKAKKKPEPKKPGLKRPYKTDDASALMKLLGFVETVWKHRQPANRDAFITDVMGYGDLDRADVEREVDHFLAERAVARVVLVDVAEWLANDTSEASSGYKGDTHEEMVDLLAGDVAKDIETVLVNGKECEVDIDQVRDAVEHTVTRGQRDLVVSKLEDANGLPLATGKTPKTLAKDTGLSIDRVGKLLASAKTDGLVDKPNGKRSWISLPAPVLPPLDPDEVSLAALNREDAKPTGEFEGEEFDAAMLAAGPARDRVIAKLVTHLPSKNVLPLRTKNPQCLANDTGIHILEVGKLLAWAKAAGLAAKRRGFKDGWVRLPAAVVAEPEVVENPAPEA